MSVRARIVVAMAVTLSSVPARAQTSPGLPAIPSVTNQAQADAVIRERDAYCSPGLDATPALASYNRPFFCTCMGAQLSAAHIAGTTVPQSMLTRMVIDCAALSHRNTARTAKPPQSGAWAESAHGEHGRPTLGWGEPDSDVGFAALWMACQPAGKTVLTVELEHGRPGQHTRVWLSKGPRSMLISGPVRQGRSGPVVEASIVSDGLLTMLGQPDDLVLHAAAAPVRFPNATLAAPLQKFVAECRRH